MYDHNYEMDYRPEPTLSEKLKEFMTYQTFLCIGIGVAIFFVLYKWYEISFLFVPLILLISIAVAYFVQTSPLFNVNSCFYIGISVICIGLGIVKFELWNFPEDLVSIGFWLYSVFGLVYQVLYQAFNDEEKIIEELFMYFSITAAIIFVTVIFILFDFFVLTIIALVIALIPAIKGIYESVRREYDLYLRTNQFQNKTK
ncbi:MAG: hypothetical protein MJ196_10150 [Treponemataceae bacterium]|nr:hypothetical protein [Treponemataceae bacterium]